MYFWTLLKPSWQKDKALRVPLSEFWWSGSIITLTRRQVVNNASQETLARQRGTGAKTHEKMGIFHCQEIAYIIPHSGVGLPWNISGNHYHSLRGGLWGAHGGMHWTASGSPVRLGLHSGRHTRQTDTENAAGMGVVTHDASLRWGGSIALSTDGGQRVQHGCLENSSCLGGINCPW